MKNKNDILKQPLVCKHSNKLHTLLANGGIKFKFWMLCNSKSGQMLEFNGPYMAESSNSVAYTWHKMSSIQITAKHKAAKLQNCKLYHCRATDFTIKY